VRLAPEFREATGTRYTDHDLRERPELVALAVRYARDYRGDWDLMRAAALQVLDSGTLTLAVARTVLNCARADPRAYQLFTEVGEQQRATEPAPAVVIPIDRHGRRTSKVQVVNRPAWVDLRATFKGGWLVWSDHRSARFAHQVHPTRSTLRYRPETGQYVPRLATWCGSMPSSNHRHTGRVAPDHLQPCRPCRERQQEEVPE
jgi:hypothetical protein